MNSDSPFLSILIQIINLFTKKKNEKKSVVHIKMVKIVSAYDVLT